MRRRTKAIFIVLTAILIAGALTVPSNASVANDVLDLVGPAVSRYDLAPYVLENSSRMIRQGVPVADGGCSFSGEKSLLPGQSVTEIEIAYDPLTCRSLVESGILVGGDEGLVAADNSNDATGAIPFTREPSGNESEASGSPASATQRAFMWSWYDEPARWTLNCGVEQGFSEGCVLPTVNFVRNQIGWEPDGVCAVPPGTTGSTPDARIQKLTATGWSVAENIPNKSPVGPLCGDQNIFNENRVRFENRLFCAVLTQNPFLPFFATKTNYQPNHVSGDKNGTAFFKWTLSKSGPCSILLRSGARFDNAP